MRKRNSSRKRRLRGATVVEFAVVAPVLFILVFAVIEFGRYVMLQQVAITSTREGSRKAALATTTVDSQVESTVRGYLTAGGVQSSVVNDPAKVAVSVTPGNVGSLERGTPITVEVRMDFGELGWLPGDFGLGSVNVVSATTMERE